MGEREATRRRRIILLSGPALYWLVLFLFLPLVLMLAISLARRGDYGVVVFALGWSDYEAAVKEETTARGEGEGEEARRPPGDPGRPTLVGYARYLLANYARAFEPQFLTIYGRSLWLATATTLVCLLVGYPVAYTIALRVPRRWQNPLLMLVIVPFWTSFLVRTYAWILILRTEGIVNGLGLWLEARLAAAGLAGLIEPPWALLYNDIAVLLGLVYTELPFMILPLYASIQKLDLTLLEAASDLGAGPVRTFLRVTLPLTRPGIVAGIVFVFIPSIGMFIVPDLLGGSKAMMVGNLVWDQFASTRDYPFGAAVSFLLTAIVLGMLWLNARVTGPEEPR